MTSHSTVTATEPATGPVRLVLVGVGGYGAVHAERIALRQAAGEVQLVAAVDPIHSEPPEIIAGTPMYADLAGALRSVGPVDVVVVAAPIAEHARLAEVALLGGADVLLEKPPVATLADFNGLLELERRTGHVVQVGFQSLGSTGIPMVTDDGLGIGDVRRVSAVGAWTRAVGYWTRSPWAGRRSLQGKPVFDGVVTNALAHAVATALALAGCRELGDVVTATADLYRANKIDCDDTSVVRVETRVGVPVTCALTLCAPNQRPPLVLLEGTRGRARFSYTTDTFEIEVGDEFRSVSVPRTDLLENLMSYRRGESPLLVPLASTGAFMRVLDAVAGAGEPVKIDPRAVTWSGEGDDRCAVVAEVEHWLAEAARTGRTFTELGVDWAHRGRDRVLVRGVLAGNEVVTYRDGGGTIAMSSPRPYLHPVRTLGGVEVTATHPADHDWHTGVGMAIPDVNGTNFWGGGTYLHPSGYAMRDDHGMVIGDPVRAEPDGFRQRLEWIGRRGELELVEERHARWVQLGAGPWRLTFTSSLRAERDAELGSPGSKGRIGGGYGGFFWRLPSCSDVDVFTPDSHGEEAVHGAVAPWVAWSADFAAGPGVTGPATLVLSSPQVVGAGEPWFVRVSDYPGIGSAIAWDEPLRLAAGESLTRRFDIAVADGRLGLEAVTHLLPT